MKIKILAVVGIAAALGLGACKGSTTNTNTNTSNAIVVTSATPTPIAKTSEAPVSTDPNMKSKVEAALKAKGFNDVTYDTSTTPATLRGSYPKDKMAEVMQTAQETSGKPVQNQATGK